ncbi:MAG: GNVR domain-containing protein [Rhodothermales bacterium]
MQRNVDFKSQLYRELQSQVTQEEISLQRSVPVVTLLENPVAPLAPSGPNRRFIVMLSLALGGMLGVVVAFIRSAMNRDIEDEEERAKVEEIKSRLNPRRWVAGMFRS